MTPPHVTVDAYAGYKGVETPRAFTLDGVRPSVEEENRRLKQMVAEQALDIQELKVVTAKNWQGPKRRELQLNEWRRALGSVSDGCAASWPSIGTRSGIGATG
jgi:hypothetical protein